MRSGLFAVVLSLLPLAYAARPAERLPLAPLNDDAFYMLAVARNLGTGGGLTHDGHPTDGVQPLATWIDALFYIGGPTDATYGPLRGVVLLQGLLFVTAAWLAGSVAAALSPPGVAERSRWLAMLGWGLSVPLFRHSLNGLETGLYLLLLLAYFRWRLATAHETPLARAAVEGVFLGIIVLARLDAVFLLAGGAAVTALWGGPTRRSVARALLLLTTAALVVGPWLLRSWTLFGTIMPSSGSAQSLDRWPGANVVMAAAALAQPLLPVLPPAALRFNATFAVPFVLLLALAWIIILRRSGTASTLAARHVVRAAAPLVILVSLSAGYYVFFFGAPHFLERYLIPFAILALPAQAVAIASLTRGSMRLQRTAAGIGIVLSSAVAIEHWLLFTASDRISGNPMYSHQYAVLARGAGPGRIGAYQSGTLGYFMKDVVNLDGKINRAALAARRSGRLPDYVCEQEVRFVIDWPPLVRQILGPHAESGAFSKRASAGGFELWEGECTPAGARRLP